MRRRRGAKRITKRRSRKNEFQKSNRLFIFPNQPLVCEPFCSVQRIINQRGMYRLIHSQFPPPPLPTPAIPMKRNQFSCEHLLHQRRSSLSAKRSLLRSYEPGRNKPNVNPPVPAKLVLRMTGSGRLCQGPRVETSAIPSVLLCAHLTGSYRLPIITDNGEQR